MKSAILGIILSLISSNLACTITRLDGFLAPSTFCAGDLVFEDNFDFVDTSKWLFDNTLGGGGNWEFQWYPGYHNLNFQIRNGVAHFIPTLTSDYFGSEAFLSSGRITIPPDQCTQADWYGCDRTGTPDNILNPTRSARIDSRRSFGFRYGTVEFRAKMPLGDWLWPAIWFMPMHNVYGGWPRSGEIDLMEMRGNYNLWSGSTHVGVEQVGHTMHFGPQWDHNGWPTAHFTRNRTPGFDLDFHLYKLVWTDQHIQFYIDNQLTGTVSAGTGFWDRGGFHNSGHANPWAGASPMAPFDQEFYIIMNLAVGGTNYFSDYFVNLPNPKPWLNTSPRAAADFWEHRHWWLPTWNMGTEQSHMQVDYVRVWAI
ncbi:hypothetical protein PVAND_007231 [Polypedilum vanderplanki]|uniref:GH16 domain-containing protein n=1 Tax=Polypedilum vanderplanki TaxID=319348 RepID=A0A9J6C5S8_POLVA|nr:hypothetical protein PVAND_007231 [Polypedilum vanderplanki]